VAFDLSGFFIFKGRLKGLFARLRRKARTTSFALRTGSLLAMGSGEAHRHMFHSRLNIGRGGFAGFEGALEKAPDGIPRQRRYMLGARTC
jgi:hypothetical protein